VVDKNQARRSLNRLQRVKTWQLVIIFILACFVSATFLRLNNIGMVERRSAVYVADNVGDNKITQNRLYDLQRYISAHMNTDIGKGVFLVSTYNRDYQELISKASNDVNPNGNIYKKAQEVCAPQFKSYSSAYLQCSLNELAKYPASSGLVDTVKLSPDAYVHSFISPVWSPDFAGWSLLVCVVILIMIIARATGVIILRFLLRKHKKSI